MTPALLHHEEPGHEAVRRLRDEDFVRPGELLCACRQVYRFAEYLGVLPTTLADHHVAGVDRDPDRELDPMLSLESLVQLYERIDDRDASARAALRAVVVNDRIPEVRKEAVSLEPREVASEALDRLRAATLEARIDRVPLLHVETRRQVRRPDDVAEQHGQVPSFPDQQVRRRRRVFHRCHAWRQTAATDAAELRFGAAGMAAAHTEPRQADAAPAAEASAGGVILATRGAAHASISSAAEGASRASTVRRSRNQRVATERVDEDDARDHFGWHASAREGLRRAGAPRAA